MLLASFIHEIWQLKSKTLPDKIACERTKVASFEIIPWMSFDLTGSLIPSPAKLAGLQKKSFSSSVNSSPNKLGRNSDRMDSFNREKR